MKIQFSYTGNDDWWNVRMTNDRVTYTYSFVRTLALYWLRDIVNPSTNSVPFYLWLTLFKKQ